MREQHEIIRAVEQYGDILKRICFLHLKNREDTEDIFQTVFLKYILYSGTFESQEHEKAWLIRVTINACKDYLRSFWRNKAVPLDILSEEAIAVSDEKHEILDAVLCLPKKYKDVIYLFYCEGYSAVEIAKIFNKNENTVYSLLSRGRTILKDRLGGEGIE